MPPSHAIDLIDKADASSVIVIAVKGDADIAVWGGLMTAGAVANKHTAAALDGAVCDITELGRDYDFPVYADRRCPEPRLDGTRRLPPTFR